MVEPPLQRSPFAASPTYPNLKTARRGVVPRKPVPHHSHIFPTARHSTTAVTIPESALSRTGDASSPRTRTPRQRTHRRHRLRGARGRAPDRVPVTSRPSVSFRCCFRGGTCTSGNATGKHRRSQATAHVGRRRHFKTPDGERAGAGACVTGHASNEARARSGGTRRCRFETFGLKEGKSGKPSPERKMLRSSFRQQSYQL